MNLSVPFEFSTEVKKNLFKLKPIRRDGLILNIHHSKSNAKIRFMHCCFDETGHIIAAADNDGHLYMVDFFTCKCWGLPKLDSCTFIKFSVFNQNDILCGRSNGDIQLIDVDSGYLTGKLLGHKEPVTCVSFSQKIYCLSASQNEAIIWDLPTNSKFRVLSLDNYTTLKHVVYMPVTDNVLICFQDDLIQIWNSGTFDLVKQFLPTDWDNYRVRSISLSRNGQTMIIAGYSPKVAVVLLSQWKVLKVISLPEYIQNVKSVEFIAQPFDGGSNKILAILADQGFLYFFDIEQNIIISQLKFNCEVLKFECCPYGSYIACILGSGEVELYNLSQYISPPEDDGMYEKVKANTKLLSHTPDDVTVDKVKGKSKFLSLKPCGDINCIRSQIESVLDVDKLKAVLRGYGEYPEAHRTRIWEKQLKLPNNIIQYNSIINHVTMVAFKDLYLQYPLESKLSIQNLKKLLNNIVTWCPFFAHVEYLPLFVFPFVKVFQNKPVSCFEAVCTVILNWCQHWFEYFPLPPVNTLAMIENLLMEHDQELLQHFLAHNVTANLYAWSLLESAFSEVLIAPEWLVLWDHILINEPAFLLCAVVAYSIVYRTTLLSLKKLPDFEFFYHNQNPNDIKKFINKCHHLLNNTSKKIHPRQYLEEFKEIRPGNYPLFVAFPKTIIDFQAEHLKGLNNELSDIENYEQELILKAGLQSKDGCGSNLQDEENRRLREMERECLKKIEKEQEKVKKKHDELQCLRKILGEEEDKVLSDVHKKWTCICTKKQSRFHEYVMDHIYCPCIDKHLFPKEHMKHITQFADLLKYKYRLKELKDKDTLPEDIENKIVKKYRKKLKTEIDKVRKGLCSIEILKRINVATSINVMENLISNIEKEMQQESASKSKSGKNRVKTLQAETTGLAKEVAKLMELISPDCNLQQVQDMDEPYKDMVCSNFKKPCNKVFFCKNVRFSNKADSVR